MRNVPGAVGINLGTADFDKVFKGGYEGPLIRLYGWITDSGEPQVSADPKIFLQAIGEASIIYGHNILASDLIAMAVHLKADYLDLARRVVDTLVGERTINPPYPKVRPGAQVNHAALRAKGLTSGDLHISYTLNAVAERYGITAEGLPQSRLPQVDRNQMCKTLLTTRAVYREMGRRTSQAGLINVVRREIRIAAIQNLMYLKGLGVDRAETERQVALAESQRQQAYSFLNKAAGIPFPNSEFRWRERTQIKVQFTTRHGMKIKARYERMFGQPCPDVRTQWRWRTKHTGPSPLATTEGRNAFESALRTFGVKEGDIPFTPKGTLALSKHALGDGAWVRGKESVPGLIAKYPENPEVLALCRAAIRVTSASAKAEEVLDSICPDGRVHPRIGDLQSSGRWAHIEPTVSNFGKRGESLQQRRMIRAKKGHILIAIDIDQADPRTIAGWSKDPEYSKLAQPGMDVHREVAFRVFGSRSDQARQDAKATTNAWNYGQGPTGAAASTGLSLTTTNRFDQGMRRAFPVLCKWRDRLRSYAARTGKVPSKWGRPLRVIPGQEYTQAPALVGQATTRDLVCDGLLRMDREVLEMLCLVIHDEIVLEVPADRVKEISERAVAALTTTFEGIPITCSASPASEVWIGCYEKAA